MSIIINKPTLKNENNSFIISAQVEILKEKKTLYYSITGITKEGISTSLDAFVVACLPLAMKCGENIIVKGLISPILAYKLEIIQGYFIFFYKDLKRIKIIAEGYEKHEKKGIATGSAFSGGVDSFYTLLSNLKKPENPSYAITDIVFIEGFDYMLEKNENHFEILQQEYSQLAKKYKVNLITVKTNIRTISDCYVDFGRIAYSPILASIGIILNNHLARFYIPSSLDYNAPFENSSNPCTDPLYATENMHIIHDGANCTRFEKIKFIAKNPSTYDNLRVCWHTPAGNNNCCTCEKCILTMASLKTLGKLEKYTTFSKPLTESLIESWRIRTKYGFYFAEEVFEKTLIRSHYKNLIHNAITRSKRKNFIEDHILQPIYRLSKKAKKYYKNIATTNDKNR